MEAPKVELPAFAAELPKDLLWLAENQGTPYRVETCHTIVRDLVPLAKKHQRDMAEARHHLGTRLIDLVTHGAVDTLECPTLAHFLEDVCGIDPDDGYEYIRFAKGVTAEQATTYLFSRCRVGISLVRELDRRDLADLAEKPFEVTAEDGTKETLTFTPTTPVSKLRRALRLLIQTPKAHAEPEEPSRALARRIRQMKEIIEDFVERHPVLAGSRVRVTLYDGVARLQHDPFTTPDEFAAAGKLYTELSKVR